LCKNNIDGNIPRSVDDFFTAYYDLCYSQLHEENNLNTLNLALSHGRKKKYSEDSYDDLEKMLVLLDSHSQEIIKQWLREKDYENYVLDFTKISEQFMVLLRVYMTICILKEIAYVRSKNKTLHSAELLGSMIKIKSYYDISKLSNRNYHENKSFINVLLSREGRTNIKKRWGQFNELKEALKKEAEDIAEKLWSGGDQSLHDDVAESIYQKIKASHEILRCILEDKYLASRLKNEEFQKKDRIDQRKEATKYADKSLLVIVRKAIIPVAEKYNRVYGMKGVFKKKLI
jgi:hypothetical protein